MYDCVFAEVLWWPFYKIYSFWTVSVTVTASRWTFTATVGSAEAYYDPGISLQGGIISIYRIKQ